MPPDANILGPWNADGSVAAASGPVNALFYPGTTNLTAALAVPVQAGVTTSGINISTTTRAAVPFYDAQIYSYFNGTIPITPAPLNISAPPPMAASVTGLGTNEPVAGLGVSVIGGAASFATQPYQANGYTYVALYPTLNAAAQPGPQHVIFTTPDYMYVIPSGIYLTQQNPPLIGSVTANGDGTLTVAGSNWNSGTQIYFDSLPASITSLNPQTGVAVVVPPAGANNQQATLTAYNSDGQNSQFLQASSAVQYAYGGSSAPQITSVSPASLPAGAEAMIDITGAGVAFAQGLTTVGFGTTDIVVQRVFVLSPSHLQVDVSVANNAALTISDVSIVTGFQIAIQPAAFQITALSAGIPEPVPSLTNALPGLTGSYAGAVVSLYGSNLSVSTTAPTVLIGGLNATLLYASPGQINLVVPTGLTPGPAILKLNNGAANAYPIVVNIDTPPADIEAVQNSTGAYISATQAAHPGDTLIVTLSNFAPAGSSITLSQAQVGVGGVSYTPTQIVQAGPVWQVAFVLDARVPLGASEPLIVYLNGRSSLPANIPVANPDDLSHHCPNLLTRTGKRFSSAEWDIIPPMNKKLLWFACATLAMAAVPAGYQHWSAEQMREHNQALLGKMDKFRDATETIGTFGNHRIITAHREGTGEAEIHTNKVDVMFVQAGEATMVIGGKMIGPRTTGPGEIRGSKIEGGERQPVGPGDILHIPANTPHWWVLEPGKKIDYYTVKITVR